MQCHYSIPFSSCKTADQQQMQLATAAASEHLGLATACISTAPNATRTAAACEIVPTRKAGHGLALTRCDRMLVLDLSTGSSETLVPVHASRPDASRPARLEPQPRRPILPSCPSARAAGQLGRLWFRNRRSHDALRLSETRNLSA